MSNSISASAACFSTTGVSSVSDEIINGVEVFIKNCVVCKITGKKSMSVGWKVSVEKRFHAKIHYLNDWAYGIQNLEDAKRISKEIQDTGLSTSAIYEEMDGTYSINWS